MTSCSKSERTHGSVWNYAPGQQKSSTCNQACQEQMGSFYTTFQNGLVRTCNAIAAESPAPDMQGHWKVICELRREEKFCILLVGSTTERNAVNLTVHHRIGICLGCENNCLGLLATNFQCGESRRMSFECLAALLFHAVKLHEALDQIRPASTAHCSADTSIIWTAAPCSS